MRRKGIWFEGAFTTAIVDELAAKQSAGTYTKRKVISNYFKGYRAALQKIQVFFAF
jgi:hypothetical protein